MATGPQQISYYDEDVQPQRAARAGGLEARESTVDASDLISLLMETLAPGLFTSLVLYRSNVYLIFIPQNEAGSPATPNWQCSD